MKKTISDTPTSVGTARNRRLMMYCCISLDSGDGRRAIPRTARRADRSYVSNQFVSAPSVPTAYVVGPVVFTTPLSFGCLAVYSVGVTTGT